MLLKLYDNRSSIVVKDILSLFFQNFVLISQSRCTMLFNSVKTLIYTILRSKYDLIKTSETCSDHDLTSDVNTESGSEHSEEMV
jgi:hypothetical protein